MPTIAYPTLVERGEESFGPVLPADAGLRLVRISEREAFGASVHEHLHGLVVATSTPGETRALVRQLRFWATDAHLLVLLSGAASGAEIEAMNRPQVKVLPASVDTPALVRALRCGWFEGRVERIRRAAHDRALPAVIRCSVSRIVGQRITAKYPEPNEVTIHRSLRVLASACGTTRETLRRSCKRSGLEIRALMQGWHVAIALRERFMGSALPREGVWCMVARRSGYESDGGLRSLVSRELGVGLSALEFTHLQEQMERLEAMVAGAALPKAPS